MNWNRDGIGVAVFDLHDFAVVIGRDSAHVVMHGGQDRNRLFSHINAGKNLCAFGDAGEFFVNVGGVEVG